MFPMTFEKKTLAIMVIEGSFDPKKADLKPSITSVTITPNQHILLYGVQTRKENDAEEALSLSLAFRSPSRKILVCMESVLFEDQTPKMDWLSSWWKVFAELSE